VPLPVLSCCTYLTDVDGVAWRSRDYDAHDFICAIKEKPINMFAQVPVRGSLRRLDDSNRDRALVWFAQMIADCADRRLMGAPVALIPVPNSHCSVGASEPPRTRALAEALAVELNGGTGGPGGAIDGEEPAGRRQPAGDAVVLDILRWSEPVQPAHLLRGTRDPQELFGRLTIVGCLDALTNRRAVLVDDVLTTGGHLQACAARIRRHGHRIDVAVVAGRADQTQVAEPFTIRIDEIAEFAPEGS
jgi:hypothetical protein